MKLKICSMFKRLAGVLRSRRKLIGTTSGKILAASGGVPGKASFVVRMRELLSYGAGLLGSALRGRGIRYHSTNWVDYCLWVGVALALWYWSVEDRHNRNLTSPPVWRVRSSIGPTIVSDTFVTSPLVHVISCRWATNYHDGAIVITTTIETNLVDLTTGKVILDRER